MFPTFNSAVVEPYVIYAAATLILVLLLFALFDAVLERYGRKIICPSCKVVPVVLQPFHRCQRCGASFTWTLLLLLVAPLRAGWRRLTQKIICPNCQAAPFVLEPFNRCRHCGCEYDRRGVRLDDLYPPEFDNVDVASFSTRHDNVNRVEEIYHRSESTQEPTP